MHSLSIQPLSAQKWYTLWVTVVTDGHSQQNTYHFATKSIDGGITPPLEHSLTQNTHPSNAYHSLVMIVPTTCATIVLSIIAITAYTVFKRMYAPTGVNGDSGVGQCDRDGADCGDCVDNFQLAVLQLQDTSTPEKNLYFQSPYAKSDIQSSLPKGSPFGHNHRPDHIYQMPSPPKWV